MKTSRRRNGSIPLPPVRRHPHPHAVPRVLRPLSLLRDHLYRPLHDASALRSASHASGLMSSTDPCSIIDGTVHISPGRQRVQVFRGLLGARSPHRQVMIELIIAVNFTSWQSQPDSNVSTTDGSREPSSSYSASGQQPDHSPYDACERLLATSPSIPARRQGISGYCCTSPHPLYSTPMKSYFLWRASGICAPPPLNNPHTLAATRLSLRNQFLFSKNHPCLARRTPKVQKILPGGESNPAFARSV
ncbi:hypothetical protein C8Q76DRAFT_448579 [Earliella scabrosa]|nr:hypothetical protein C8Q76DRAFT_448579 [Earliella scabrosa]